MTRTVLRVMLAVGLFGTGWVTAKAQSSAPTFELQIDAPGGQTQIRCVRGCKLAWVERESTPTRPTLQPSNMAAMVRHDASPEESVAGSIKQSLGSSRIHPRSGTITFSLGP